MENLRKLYKEITKVALTQESKELVDVSVTASDKKDINKIVFDFSEKVSIGSVIKIFEYLINTYSKEITEIKLKRSRLIVFYAYQPMYYE